MLSLAVNMNVRRQCVGGAVGATLLWALLFAPALTAVAVNDPPAAEDAVIAAGQEDLLAQMLGKGATLPEQCTLAAGDVDHAIITATYTCPGGDVVFELRHPSNAPATATRTARFAITLVSGSPPAGLADALAARLRSRETDFEWTLLGARRLSVAQMVLPAAGVVGLAILGWALWRQRSVLPTQLP